MRFVDEAIIGVKSGKGGKGCVAFRREKFIPRGGPNGGDGGKGGDVIFVAEPRLLTLYDLRLKRRYEAQNGQPGLGSQMNGRGGEDLLVPVPVGTLLYELPPKDAAGESLDTHDAALGAADDDTADDTAGAPASAPPFGRRRREGETLLADLAVPGQRFVVARGGRGGKGNMHFKTSTMRAPRFAQPGEEGEERRLRLELKILADVGLLGMPNAGKSTLISAVSAARPKIAAYPFTTLVPNLGVITRDDQDAHSGDMGRQLVIADIPGLIEGAHAGQGLGHAFLKHVERTRLLVHLLSVEEIHLEADDPFAGFSLIDDELTKYDVELGRKPQIKAVNKIDLWPADQLDALRAEAARRGLTLHFVSALRGDGLGGLLEDMWRMAGQRDTLPPTDPAAEQPADRQPDDDGRP